MKRGARSGAPRTWRLALIWAAAALLALAALVAGRINSLKAQGTPLAESCPASLVAGASDYHGLTLVLFLTSTLLVPACADDPPDKEMQQAQAAIDTARAAGANEYAHGEFAAAEDALKRAREAVGQRDYRLALNNALDSRDRAQTATKEAVEQQKTARADAQRALTEASTALADANARLKAAETAHKPARLLSDVRRSIADGDQALQKARAAFEAGHYHDVAKTLNDSNAHLAGVARELDGATGAAPRRRR